AGRPGRRAADRPGRRAPALGLRRAAQLRGGGRRRGRREPAAALPAPLNPTQSTGAGTGSRCRTAQSATSVRDTEPVLRSRFDTCTVTVRTEMPSAFATCLLDIPATR